MVHLVETLPFYLFSRYILVRKKRKKKGERRKEKREERRTEEKRLHLTYLSRKARQICMKKKRRQEERELPAKTIEYL